MFGIAATEGHQGVHVYYTGSVPVGLLEHLVKFPEDLGLQHIAPDNRRVCCVQYRCLCAIFLSPGSARACIYLSAHRHRQIIICHVSATIRLELDLRIR